MKEFWSKLKKIFGNKWVKFTLVSVIYILWFVVWSRNPWMLLGLPVIYDIYISKFLSRKLLTKHKKRKKESKSYREVWGWIDAIIFAAIAIPLISIYFFQNFKIPSSSMEKTLLVGDHLCVSKLAYGPKLPNTPISMPFVHNAMPFSGGRKKSYSEIIRSPYKRIAGFGDVRRGDIVVFNFPAGDTVLLENINATYYDVLRGFQAQYGEKAGRDAIERQFTLQARPVDKREHYVKRCVAVPGDTLSVSQGYVYINGKQQDAPKGMEFRYWVKTNGTAFSRSVLDKLGLSEEDCISYQDNTYWINLTQESLDRIKQMPNVVSIVRDEDNTYDMNIFPQDYNNFPWSLDTFGPLWIPKKGTTVELSMDNIALYERIIKNYENNSLEIKDGVIFINGTPANGYTFKMDYYFMMGDNRHGSLDSRFWGFVPEDHVVGKPAFIFWSKNMDRGGIRWNRMFTNPK